MCSTKIIRTSKATHIYLYDIINVMLDGYLYIIIGGKNSFKHMHKELLPVANMKWISVRAARCALFEVCFSFSGTQRL